MVMVGGDGDVTVAVQKNRGRVFFFHVNTGKIWGEPFPVDSHESI